MKRTLTNVIQLRPTGVVKLKVNLSREVADVLTTYRARHGIHYTEAIRRAISVLAFFDEAAFEGSRILVEKPNGDLFEVRTPYLKEH